MPKGIYQRTNEMRKNMSIAFKGRKMSEETRRKIGLAFTGKNSPSWKGGRNKLTNGYIKVWINANTYQLEHRYVMEKHIGRKLTEKEEIHHLNGIKTDNRIENLVIMSKKTHGKYHSDKYHNATMAKNIPPRICQICRNTYFYKAKDGLKAFNKRKFCSNNCGLIYTRSFHISKKVKSEREKI